MSKQDKILKSKLDLVRPFVEERKAIHFRRDRLFSACLRSSFVRAFELVDYAAKPGKGTAYFLAANLRSVTEDVIVLRYMSSITKADREKLIFCLMQLDLVERLEQQERFFSRFRPFQPVLGASDLDSEKLRENAIAIWRKNGWPNIKRSMPPTRQLAEKSDPGVLEVIYDFIFRLTSGLVHFNPQILLRAGWGASKMKPIFSTQNMEGYYLAFSRIYGCYLFCLYFEFFGKFLRPSRSDRKNVRELRAVLLERFRWPEMVTFEEMNIHVPQPSFINVVLAQTMHAEIYEKGFIRAVRE